MAFEEEDAPGAPEWIVTFSDMISLLVTFFVLLLSFASVAEKDEAKMTQFLRGMWGLFPSEKDSAIETTTEEISPDRTYRTNASLDKSSRPFEEVLHELERAGLRTDDERLPIDLSATTSGVRLTFGPGERFGIGDDQVNLSLDRALVRIADVVRNYDYEIVIEGHADGSKVRDPRFADASALSLARAAAAAAVMTRSGKMDPRTIVLAGTSPSASTEGTGGPSATDADGMVELRLVPIVRR